MLTFVILILSAGTALAVYRAIKKAFQQYSCITTEDIRAYKLSKLNQSDRRRVAVHLGVCKKCQQSMINYDPDAVNNV